MQNKKYRLIAREPRVLTGRLRHGFIEMQRLAKNPACFPRATPEPSVYRRESPQVFDFTWSGRGESNARP